MKEGKKVLSVQVEVEVIEQLKFICAEEDRSQAKIIKKLINEKYKQLKSYK